MWMTAGDLASTVQGTILKGDAGRLIERIGTDTRTIAKGDLYWALDGTRFRGEDFIPAAIAAGASGVVCERPPKEFPSDLLLVQVRDTLRAYGDIGHAWRRLANPRVVALSGSAGKTTTREMLAHIARGKKKVLSTDGNRNNLIGLPQTLLRLEKSHDIAVIELGMNQPGELTRLTRIADPEILLMTNIGNAHIGNFGTMERLIAGEAEAIQAVRRDTVAILNLDCPHCSMLPESFAMPETIITYGQEQIADVCVISLERLRPFGYKVTMRIIDEEVTTALHLYGRYQVNNALAAAAGAAALGMDAAQIASRLESFRTPGLRNEIETTDGIYIIKDCYNASPASMAASLRSVEDFHTPGRRFALLGEMRELGDLSEAFHRDAGRVISELPFHMTLCIGPATADLAEEARRYGANCEYLTSREEAVRILARELAADDLLLVKGSRSNKLEELVEALRAERSSIRNGERIPQTDGAEV